MKKIIIFFALFSIILTAFGCKKETDITFSKELDAIAGTWKIKSITATNYANNGTSSDEVKNITGNFIFIKNEDEAYSLNRVSVPVACATNLNAFIAIYTPLNPDVNGNTTVYWYPDQEGRRLLIWNTYQTYSYRSIADMSRSGNEMILVFYTQNSSYGNANPTAPSISRRETIVLEKQ